MDLEINITSKLKGRESKIKKFDKNKFEFFIM